MKRKKSLLVMVLAICMLFSAGIALSACNGLKDNEVDVTIAAKEYDGQAIEVNAEALHEAGITVEFKQADAEDETYSEVAPVNAGRYTVRVTVAETEEYKQLVVTRNFEITQRQVNVNWYEPENLVYSKEAKMPTVALSSALVAGDECTVTPELKEGEDNVNVGEFTCKATLSNANYKVVEAQAEHSYTIVAKQVMLNWPNVSYQYDKTAHLPTVTISSGLIDGDECEVIEAVAEGDDNVNAGNFYCDVELSNSNYVVSGQTSRQYSISKAYYGYIKQKYRRPDSDSWSVSNFKVGETLYWEAYTDENDVFEGELTFALYDEGEGHYIHQTGDGRFEGNILTATKYGNIWVQARVAESRNYYSRTSGGVQGITINGLECVEGEQYEVPTDRTGKYGQTLADVSLPQGFTWNAPDTQLDELGEHSFKATFTPYLSEDVGVYKPKTNIDITVTVGKGDPAYEVPTGLTAKYGQLVSDVALPDGFTWHTSGTPVGGIIGQNAHLVDFTPADTEHFNVVLNILVYIEVTKADQNITVQHNSKEFDGDPITAADLGLSYLGDGVVTLEFKLASDPDSAYSSSIAPNAAHEYSVRITVQESSHYLEGVKEVTFTIYMPE